jgi:hypothetical protein
MNKVEFEKMCRYYFRKGDEAWIISTLLQYHSMLFEGEE